MADRDTGHRRRRVHGEHGGKYFDVKFILYDAETKRVLDEIEIDRAWFVKEIVVLGTIYGCGIE